MEILIQIVITFFAVWFYSFLTKKGENLADKQDIANITHKVEEVKLEFSDKSYFSTKKKETYEKIMDSMRVFISGHLANKEEKEKMLESYSLAYLWASDEVIKKINKHLNLQIKKTTNSSSITQNELKESYRDCILEMRKDAGYFDTKLKREDFHFVSFN